MTGRAREQLATDLGHLLPGYKTIPDPRTIDNLDPGKVATLQVVRAKFARNPIAPQAQYLEQLHVWVISHQKEQPAAENDLDDRVLEVTDALTALSGAGWGDAERMKHPDGHHAYRITTTYITEKE